MANTKIIFKGKMMFAQYSLEVIIDNQTTINIANGSSTDIELNEGMHTITASIPIQGNKMALTSVQFEVKPSMNYEVTYASKSATVNAMSVMEVKEISAGTYGGSGVIIAKSKGRKNSMMIFSVVFGVIFIIAMMSILSMSGIFNFSFGSLNVPNNTVVTILNEPCRVSNTQITVTDITSTQLNDDEITVTVGITVENVSDKTTIYVNSPSRGYVDNTSVRVYDEREKSIQYGNLEPGKSTSGYSYFNASNNAEHFEMIIELGLSDKTVTLSFDIPPIESKTAKLDKANGDTSKEENDKSVPSIESKAAKSGKANGDTSKGQNNKSVPSIESKASKSSKANGDTSKGKNDNTPSIKYDNKPFTVTEYSYDGSVRYRTSIESFKITSIDSWTSNLLRVNNEIIGKTEGTSYISLKIKCYDSEGFLLETASIWSSITDGERFKVSESFYAPTGTVRIEFEKD